MTSTQKAQKPYRGVRRVVAREWKRFRADGSLKLLLFVIAPLLAWSFCAIYDRGTVSDLPVAVVDNDHSSLSRTMIRSLNATKTMRVITYVNSVEEIEKGIANGDFAAGFVFPAGMLADVKASRQVQPQLFCNGINYLAATLIIRESRTVLKTISAGIVKTRLVKSGMSDGRALALVSPVVVDLSNLYNPTMSYKDYLSPGLVFAQLGTIFMLLGALCFARERERNTLSGLRLRAGAHTFSALHGKFVFHLLIITIVCVLVCFVLFPAYRIGSVSGCVKVFPGLLLFMTASWWMGAFIGIVAGKATVAASFSFAIGMPAFLFSGWTFPLPAAPPLYTVVAAVLPFPRFMPIWFATAQKGMGVFADPADMAVLVVMIVIAHFLTRMLLMYFWNRPVRGETSHA